MTGDCCGGRLTRGQVDTGQVQRLSVASQFVTMAMRVLAPWSSGSASRNFCPVSSGDPPNREGRARLSSVVIYSFQAVSDPWPQRMFFELSPAALSSGLGGLMAQPFDGVLQLGVPQQG